MTGIFASVVEAVARVFTIRALSLGVERLLGDLFFPLVSSPILLNLKSLDQVAIRRRDYINHLVPEGRHERSPIGW